MPGAQVILVDSLDTPLGTMEKMEAHRRGVLHRAFSIFIMNSKGELLLQRRALTKYHSPGLWSNTCCSHPSPGEETQLAANRRLQEELGFQTVLQPIFTFVYMASFDNGLTEHEYDHVFFGRYDGEIKIDPTEIDDIAFETPAIVRKQLVNTPERFTAWFAPAFAKFEAWREAAHAHESQ